MELRHSYPSGIKHTSTLFTFASGLLSIKGSLTTWPLLRSSLAAINLRVSPDLSWYSCGRYLQTTGVNSSRSTISEVRLSKNHPTIAPTISVANKPRGAIQWYDIWKSGKIVSGSCEITKCTCNLRTCVVCNYENLTLQLWISLMIIIF